MMNMRGVYRPLAALVFGLVVLAGAVHSKPELPRWARPKEEGLLSSHQMSNSGNGGTCHAD